MAPRRTAVGTTQPMVTKYLEGQHYRAAVGLFFSDKTAEIHAVDCTSREEAVIVAKNLHYTVRRQAGLPYPAPQPLVNPPVPRRF